MSFESDTQKQRCGPVAVFDIDIDPPLVLCLAETTFNYE